MDYEQRIKELYNEPINLDKKMLDFKFGYPYHNYERSI